MAVFEKLSLALNISPQKKLDLICDAEDWWAYSSTRYKDNSIEMGTIYWRKNCKEPMAKLRGFVKVQNSKENK